MFAAATLTLFVTPRQWNALGATERCSLMEALASQHQGRLQASRDQAMNFNVWA